MQNYIDDLGVQVADIIVGFRELEAQSLDRVRRIADTTRFDYYCWDLYSRVTGVQRKTGRASRCAPPPSVIPSTAGTPPSLALIVDRIVCERT